MSLPKSKESEQALLGAILINASILDKVDLEAEEFYDTEHQKIYRAMKAVGSELDVVVLAEVMERQGFENTIYLTSLVNQCPSSFNYDTYVKIIRDTSARRKVIAQAEILATAAFDEERKLSDAISLAVTELVKTAKPSGGAVHVSTFLKRLYEQAEKRASNPKRIYGLETGLSDFDRITHGLQKGEQFILSGAPGTGKSLLAFQLACGMAKHGHPGVVYELEMTGTALVRRNVSSLSRIPTDTILSGIEMNNKWDDFARAIDDMEELPIFISEESAWTTMQIRADLSRMREQHGVEWFVVDYMERLGDTYGKDGIERSTYISHQLHGIVKDLGMAGLTLQAVTKQGFDRGSASMAHVAGSHSVHHDADQIAMLTKGTPEEPDLKDVVTVSWTKHREGSGDGIMSLYKVPDLPKFELYRKEAKEVVQWWTRDKSYN